jgi:hypothetical protein
MRLILGPAVLGLTRPNFFTSSGAADILGIDAPPETCYTYSVISLPEWEVMEP